MFRRQPVYSGAVCDLHEREQQLDVSVIFKIVEVRLEPFFHFWFVADDNNRFVRLFNKASTRSPYFSILNLHINLDSSPSFALKKQVFISSSYPQYNHQIVSVFNASHKMSIHSLEKMSWFFIGRGQRIHLVDEETPQTVGDDLLCHRGLTQIPGDQIVSRNLLNVPFWGFPYWNTYVL
jgi:hypothetical protein